MTRKWITLALAALLTFGLMLPSAAMAVEGEPAEPVDDEIFLFENPAEETEVSDVPVVPLTIAAEGFYLYLKPLYWTTVYIGTPDEDTVLPEGAHVVETFEQALARLDPVAENLLYLLDNTLPADTQWDLTDYVSTSIAPFAGDSLFVAADASVTGGIFAAELVHVAEGATLTVAGAATFPSVTLAGDLVLSGTPTFGGTVTLYGEAFITVALPLQATSPIVLDVASSTPGYTLVRLIGTLLDDEQAAQLQQQFTLLPTLAQEFEIAHATE